MTRGKTIWAGLGVVAMAATVGAVDLLHGSGPATTEEIRTAISGGRPECRNLLRDRLRQSMLRNGAVSRRQLNQFEHMECRVSGPQYDAAGG